MSPEDILLILIISVGIFIGFVRNTIVFFHMRKLIFLIQGASLEDCKKGRSWLWRFDELSKINQMELVFKFWIDLKDIPADKSMLDPEALGPMNT